MKKILLILMVCFAFSSNAQITKTINIADISGADTSFYLSRKTRK